MLSEKQLEANRANSQKSTGPTSQEGKERSRLNAFRHGGAARLVPEEEMEAFLEFTNPIVAGFNPVGANEIQLAQQYAGFQWRIQRISAIEDTLFSIGLVEGSAGNLQIQHPQAHRRTGKYEWQRTFVRERG